MSIHRWFRLQQRWWVETMADAVLDIDELERNASDLRREFEAAAPFPHLVVDDLLRIPPDAASAFPDISWPGWNEMRDRYQQNKRSCADLNLIPEPFSALIRELCEPRFLRVLEQITGIKPVLPDPYLLGGGLHLSGPGGILSPHTDFHYHRPLNLYRRINVLVYLNDGWSLQDGVVSRCATSRAGLLRRSCRTGAKSSSFGPTTSRCTGFPCPSPKANGGDR